MYNYNCCASADPYENIELHILGENRMPGKWAIYRLLLTSSTPMFSIDKFGRKCHVATENRPSAVNIEFIGLAAVAVLPTSAAYKLFQKGLD